MHVLKDALSPQGHVEVFVARGAPVLRPGGVISVRDGLGKMYRSCDVDFSTCELLDRFEKKNLILGQGKNAVIKTIASGFFNPICRMAIGDLGTIPSDPTVPKVPTDSDPDHPTTGLFHEIYRGDIDATVLNVTASAHEAKFIKIFNAADIPLTAYSLAARPVVNEVGLVTADLLGIEGGAALPRDPVVGTDSPAADEKVFSIRTFKSVPFIAAQAISITIRYTIYIPE